jgi:hypothetical protein
MLGLAARHADIWNRDFDAVNPGFTPYSAADLTESQTRADAACAAIERDPATLERTAGVWVDLPSAPRREGWDALSGTADEIAAGLRVYADTGYSQVQVWLNQPTIEGIEAFASVVELAWGDG